MDYSVLPGVLQTREACGLAACAELYTELPQLCAAPLSAGHLLTTVPLPELIALTDAVEPDTHQQLFA